MSPDTSASFRRGIRIGVDVGSVRIGVARTDPDALIAVPVRTLMRPRPGAPRSDLVELAAVAVEYDAMEIVVGLPLTMAGVEGVAAVAARTYATELAAMLGDRGVNVGIRMVDERLTTAQAAKGLQAAGRDSRSGRSVIDQVAAVIIVQSAVDAERITGVPPGSLLTVQSASAHMSSEGTT